MKRITRYSFATIMAVGTLLAGWAHAEEASSAAMGGPQMEAMMQAMAKAGTPGAAHKALEPLVGSWTVEVKSWMSPDAPPTVTKGSAMVGWIMGGRYLQEEFSGEFMGKPFHGMSLTGYDNTKEKYGSVWIDDMHTGLFPSEGEASDKGKVITLEGRFDCPITGQKNCLMKQVLRIVSPDKHTLEMYDMREGDGFKTMEIVYMRD